MRLPAPKHGGARLLVNARSGRAALEVPAPSLMLDDGSIERRVRLLRPMEQHSFAKDALAETHWEEAARDAFAKAWQEEIAAPAGVHREHVPHRDGAAAADLAAAAG